MREPNEGFIQQTAEDYDLPYYEVEQIYTRWFDSQCFYEKLEELLKERSNY